MKDLSQKLDKNPSPGNQRVIVREKTIRYGLFNLFKKRELEVYEFNPEKQKYVLCK